MHDGNGHRRILQRFNFLILVLAIASLLATSCVSYDSGLFEPTELELKKSERVRFYGPGQPVIFDRCVFLGEMKINEMEMRNPSVVSPSLVAVRKYPSANLVVHINSRTDGGIDGEFDARFYLVLNCGIFN
jgi:hypothetical protein